METVYVSVGSNIDRELNIRAGVQSLRSEFGDLDCSSVYESEAEGFDGDPFFNLVLRFEAENLPNINELLRGIEKKHGRTRQAQKFCPRTLDLDLLLFGSQILQNEGWDIPRSELTRYAFILWPMAELAPGLVHPLEGRSMQQLWDDFLKQNPTVVHRIKPIEFELGVIGA